MRISMKFEKTAEMIFELCSRRVKNRVEESGKSLEVLYPENPKLISLIQNNRRDKYHNRYLLTAAGIDVLVPALGFHSIEELLWGTKQEQDSYFLRFLLWENYRIQQIQILISIRSCVHMLHMQNTIRFTI